MVSVKSVLQAFIQEYLSALQQRNLRLKQEYDPAWPSPCQIGPPNSTGMIVWQPVECTQSLDFSGLEHALETALHDDIKQYYGSFWSDSLAADHAEGEVSLILLWNEADFQRLVGNIIGHALAKRKAKQPLSIFFACTEEDSELFLSVDNSTGKVLLEQPGQPPLREVASSLAEFLQQLRPAVERMAILSID